MTTTRKTAQFLLASALAVSLSACGASTGGLAKSLAKDAAMKTVSNQVSPQTVAPSVVSAPLPDAAASTEPTPTPIVRRAKTNKKCKAIAEEMNEIDANIVAYTEIINNGGSSLAGQAAATGASHAAVHSGAANALMKVPFGGLFAKSAIDSLANSGAKKVEKAQKDLEKANLRKATLTGLYTGKDCAA
ncbi:hypothetical protein DES40_1695 [Litorimonas taeanensis]|uniref:Lipoprotein n=1 Tax=Litorimonas taeanensis TaxID=568099 RepID=A0A420WDB7_9PROT|nr:hypothetical protein [Litorimonas taeanensis]RKQ68920.1 hypothetical protein DES40_1695 [Litorimonas taeanensis]